MQSTLPFVDGILLTDLFPVEQDEGIERYNLHMPKQHRSHEELMRCLVERIQQDTERMKENDLSEDCLPTAASLARELDERLETVKKKLSQLREEDVVCAMGMNPKRYRYNAWSLKEIQRDEDHPLHFLTQNAQDEFDEEQDWQRRNAWRN